MEFFNFLSGKEKLFCRCFDIRHSVFRSTDRFPPYPRDLTLKEQKIRTSQDTPWNLKKPCIKLLMVNTLLKRLIDFKQPCNKTHIKQWMAKKITFSCLLQSLHEGNNYNLNFGGGSRLCIRGGPLFVFLVPLSFLHKLLFKYIKLSNPRLHRKLN